MRRIDLTGEQFHRWTVLSFARLGPRGKGTYWLCRCECGTEKEVLSNNLRRGLSQSCGCLLTVPIMERDMDGRSVSSEYTIWRAMRSRCNNPNNHAYRRYGGRGITVCPEWSDFDTFLRDMGPRPSERHSLDRIDNDGPYDPDNCRWSTYVEQNSNRRDNRTITWMGRTQTIAQWNRELHDGRSIISRRLADGWSEERAMSQPVLPQGKGRHKITP